MKITIAPDGSVELEVGNGEGQAALDMIRSLQGQEKKTAERPPAATAALTPVLRDAMEVVTAYPQGCHYRVLAEYLGISPASANSRLQELRRKGLATWIKAGVYAPAVGSAE